MTVATPVELLRKAATDFAVQELSCCETGATFKVPVDMLDGRQVHFTLTVGAVNDDVEVREDQADRRLPQFCPERHINRDGSFCLGFAAPGEHSITSEQSAMEWWERLLQFLRGQLRAERARRWTMGNTWAHGKAANYQREAEYAASLLGANFLEDLTSGRLSVVKSKVRVIGRYAILKLQRDGVHLCSVWMDPWSVANKRRACICTAGDVKRHRCMRNCRNHADATLRLVRNLYEWQLAEIAFWDSLKGTTCCRTIQGCPLERACSLTGGQNAGC